jgi:hypothetical protein
MTSIPLRFEDIAQDGRIVLPAMQHLLGATTWPDLFRHPWAGTLRDQGIVPILTFVEIENGDGPFSNVGTIVEATGRWELGHVLDANKDKVERLLVAMWVDAQANIGSTYGPPPPRAGELAFAGKIYAEHVVTRLFAPPAERKITRLDVEGLDPVPPKVLAYTVPESVSVLPTTARPIAEGESSIAFGVTHTDGNHHVNSLVYARMFEEAVLRLPGFSDVHGRKVRVGYRKPFFAGSTAQLRVRAFEDGGRKGACGTFDAGGKSHVHVTMLF